MSRLTYGIQVLGPSIKPSVMARVQTVQNQAALWITGLNSRSMSEDVLDSIGWLSMYQLSVHHSLLTLWNIYNLKKIVRNLETL